MLIANLLWKLQDPMRSGLSAPYHYYDMLPCDGIVNGTLSILLTQPFIVRSKQELNCSPDGITRRIKRTGSFTLLIKSSIHNVLKDVSHERV